MRIYAVVTQVILAPEGRIHMVVTYGDLVSIFERFERVKPCKFVVVV